MSNPFEKSVNGKTMVLSTLESDDEIETCLYCETKYTKHSKSCPVGQEDTYNSCPHCGKTATWEMDQPKQMIAQVYDKYWKEMRKHPEQYQTEGNQ